MNVDKLADKYRVRLAQLENGENEVYKGEIELIRAIVKEAERLKKD